MILAAALAWAAESPDYHYAQAKKFLQKGWRDDAEQEVAAGLALDPQNVGLNGLCVTLAREKGDLDRAIACAHAGATASEGNLDERARLSQLEAWMRENFGWIEVRGPDGATRAVLDAVVEVGFLDEELQRAHEAAAARMRGGLTLPARVALPAGAYRIANQDLKVHPSQTTDLELPASHFAASAGQAARVELALGAIAYVGDGFDNQRPGGALEAGVSVPAGALRLAMAASWELRSYVGAGSPELAVNTYGALLRLGGEVPLGNSLLFVPAGSLRFNSLPGVAMGCEDTGDPITCSLGAPGDSQFSVFANAFAFTPTAEAGIALQAGRITLGMRARAGRSVVLVPSPGPVQLSDRITEYAVEPNTVGATSFGGDLTIGFGL